MGSIKRGGFGGDNFTVIANSAARDPRISFKAKGVLLWLGSHREGWFTSEEKIAESGPDGLTAVRSALAELERFGYLTRGERVRLEDGTLAGREYLVTDSPARGDGVVTDHQHVETGSRPRTGETPQNPRSDPTCGFPTLDNHMTKKTKSKNTKEENQKPPRGNLASDGSVVPPARGLRGPGEPDEGSQPPEPPEPPEPPVHWTQKDPAPPWDEAVKDVLMTYDSTDPEAGGLDYMAFLAESKREDKRANPARLTSLVGRLLRGLDSPRRTTSQLKARIQHNALQAATEGHGRAEDLFARAKWLVETPLPQETDQPSDPVHSGEPVDSQGVDQQTG